MAVVMGDESLVEWPGEWKDSRSRVYLCVSAVGRIGVGSHSELLSETVFCFYGQMAGMDMGFGMLAETGCLGRPCRGIRAGSAKEMGAA